MVINKFRTCCDPTNDNALHLYQKLGFEQVGVHIIQNWIMKKVLI